MGYKKQKIRAAINRAKARGERRVNPKYMASCLGKVRYSDGNIAAEKARNLSTSTYPICSYKCKYCTFYHIGRKQ